MRISHISQYGEAYQHEIDGDNSKIYEVSVQSQPEAVRQAPRGPRWEK